MKTTILILMMGLCGPLFCQMKVKYGVKSVMNNAAEETRGADQAQLSSNYWGGEGFLRIYSGRLLGTMALGYKHSGNSVMHDDEGAHSMALSQGMTSFTIGGGGKLISRPSVNLALMGGVRPALRNGDLDVTGMGRMKRFALAATSYLELDLRRFTLSAGATRSLMSSYSSLDTRPMWGVDFGLGLVL